MKDTIHIGELSIRVTRKPIKHVHLSVHPPDGRVTLSAPKMTRLDVAREPIKHVHLSVHPPDVRVTLSAPKMTRLDVARAYTVSKVGWIREQQSRLRSQARETPRQFIERESHYLWGRRHLLTVAYRETKPFVSLDHRRITLTVRPGSDAEKRAAVIHDWHKSLLHEVVPTLIKKWEPKLKVKVAGYFLQRMKTKWGSCNHAAGHIRLNTELVKKPKDLLEYEIGRASCRERV